MWECKKCGKCCREITVLLPTPDKDIVRDYKCPYLGEDNLCTIYEFRFTFCRDYECEVKDAI